MRSLFGVPVTSGRVFEISFLLVGAYLLFHPALAHPRSYAVALGAGLFLFLLRSIPRGSGRLLGRSWWAFLLFLPLSALWSDWPGETLRSAGFVYLGTILYLLSRSLGVEGRARIAGGGLALAAAASLVALHQWDVVFERAALLLPQQPPEDLKVLTAAAHNRRAFGPLVTPGALGALLIFFIPLAVLWTVPRRGGKRILFGGLALILVFGLLATKSVGAWVSLCGASMTLLAWRTLRVKGPGSSWIWLLAVAAAGGAAVWGLIQDRGIHSWLSASFSMRLGLWESAWGLFLNNFFLGTGLGTFGETYQIAGLDLDSGSRYAHNLVLQLLVETGLVGTVLFLAALAGFLRRLKVPSRWEGWGVLTGALSVLIFSLIDLPFQMPELTWIFLGAMGLLELRPPGKEDPETLPAILREGPPKLLQGSFEILLLAVLLVGGFWPPFTSWNFTLLAVALWGALGLSSARFERFPLWVLLGAAFLVLRALDSPSAPGAVRFLEVAGILLAFGSVVRSLPDPRRFLVRFFGLGVLFGLAVWGYSFLSDDIKDWRIFPNPKHVGIFMVGFLLLRAKEPLGWGTVQGSSWTARGWFVFGIATLFRLKAFSALVGLILGALVLVDRKGRRLLAGLAVILVLALLAYRVTAYRSLDGTPTHWDRIPIWTSALQVWSRDPILGAGPGAFEGLYHRVKEPRASGVNRYLMDARYAHSEALDLLVAFGLVGVLFLGLFLWKAWPRGDPGRGAAATALGASSLVDYCLHTPLIALQGAGLAVREGSKRSAMSWPGGLLALGLAFTLFGSAAFAPRALAKAADLEEKGIYRESLQRLRSACRLDAWHPGPQKARAEFLEKLFLSTGDERWARRSEAALLQAMELARTDGYLRFDRARVLTNRMARNAEPRAMARAAEAWAAAREALPFDAFVRFEEAFFLRNYPGREAGPAGEEVRDRAVRGLREAVGLEPNFAPAWFQLGLWLREDGRKDEAPECFKKALAIHREYGSALRIDPLEERLVGLTPERVAFLEKEERSWAKP